MKTTLRHIYLCRTANMSWRTCVVVKQIQSNPVLNHMMPFISWSFLYPWWNIMDWAIEMNIISCDFSNDASCKQCHLWLYHWLQKHIAVNTGHTQWWMIMYRLHMGLMGLVTEVHSMMNDNIQIAYGTDWAGHWGALVMNDNMQIACGTDGVAHWGALNDEW